VFTIALGYSGMILSGLWAHLCMLKPSKQNHRVLYGILVFGMSFTVIGILLGGIWADLAWGRFWGWDPKEWWCSIFSPLGNDFATCKSRASHNARGFRLLFGVEHHYCSALLVWD
jgi:hypothetical protein